MSTLQTMSVLTTEDQIAAITPAANDSMLSLSKQAIESSNLKSWTVQDYHRMSELGILDPNERTELIDGQITLMVAKGNPHILTVRLLTRTMETSLSDRPILVSIQEPIQLNNSSEPEPDLAIVQGNMFDYADRHPQPTEIHLIIEVADSTLKYDCQVKDKHYAKANIPDYWVVDLKKRQVHVFRNPTPTGYASQLILAESQIVSPLDFPDVVIPISSILPPV
jgi:Uma2 family endonuclease